MDMTISSVLQFAEIDIIWFAIYLGMITSVFTVFLVIWGIFNKE